MSSDEKSPTENPYHPDIGLFLIIIPFISAINYYLTYHNIHFNGFLLLTFTIDTVQGYLAWLAVRKFIFYLDKAFPFERGFVKRVLIQLISSLAIGLLIIAALTELVSWIAKGQLAPLNFYTIDLVIIGIWFFVITGIYTGLRYYNLWKQSEKQREEERRLRSGGIMVKLGKTDLKLTFADLAGLFVEGEYAVACDVSGKKYILDDSLEKIEKELPSTLFFRLNRQFILHRESISGFKRSENGKIVVLPNKPGAFPDEIPVSRTKAPSFKGWFRP